MGQKDWNCIGREARRFRSIRFWADERSWEGRRRDGVCGRRLLYLFMCDMHVYIQCIHTRISFVSRKAWILAMCMCVCMLVHIHIHISNNKWKESYIPTCIHAYIHMRISKQVKKEDSGYVHACMHTPCIHTYTYFDPYAGEKEGHWQRLRHEGHVYIHAYIAYIHIHISIHMQVKKKDTGNVYAMKVISKSSLREKDYVSKNIVIWPWIMHYTQYIYIYIYIYTHTHTYTYTEVYIHIHIHFCGGKTM